MPVSVEQNGETVMMEDKNKREDAKPSQVKTLPNGLVIRELGKGKEDGKIAAMGKKVVHLNDLKYFSTRRIAKLL